MKMAYVTTYDSADVHAWSGLGNYALRSLQNSGFKTEAVGKLSASKVTQGVSIIKKIYYTKFRAKKYLRDREPALLKGYSAQVDRVLASIDCDVVFSPGTLPIAYMQTKKPIVFWTDATFAGMVDYYPDFSNLCAETIIRGNHIEQMALSKSRLAIYSSEWAANTAIEYYQIDPKKVKVVPFGANIECRRTLSDISRMAEGKNFDVCKLLFLGVDWLRKGGGQALAVAELLNQRGVKTELHIVGCNAPRGLPSFVKNHGFISKRSPAGLKALDRLFSESHFLILPSLADCVPVVFAEASSFGLPSLSTNVGGVSSAIQEGKNGWTFPLGASPGLYCDKIAGLMSCRESYRAMALTTFTEYTEKLNWQTASKRVAALIRESC